LDRETEELKHETVPLDLGRLIQQGRQAKNLSQKDLASVRIVGFD
jgi:putative transcription factor